jgi:hypothetical protein
MAIREAMVERASSKRIQFAGTSGSDLNAAIMSMRGADFRARRDVQGMKHLVQRRRRNERGSNFGRTNPRRPSPALWPNEPEVGVTVGAKHASPLPASEGADHLWQNEPWAAIDRCRTAERTRGRRRNGARHSSPHQRWQGLSLWQNEPKEVMQRHRL